MDTRSHAHCIYRFHSVIELARYDYIKNKKYFVHIGLLCDAVENIIKHNN